MNTQNNDRNTTSATNENNETMDFLAGKLDEATPCPADTGARTERESPTCASSSEKARE